ncbi:hypothetical protein [Streptomyces sp. DH37]|uniref:hypothetical protein n=1 Tax=Streptomyces sp. DH37 TaxID=3040122 RepID=UPI002442D385|nr:hypothetical protein [Streptomyces sp. DH37]MDG9706264.1 hypothetical protein [Streptomyces sp. DH37]
MTTTNPFADDPTVHAIYFEGRYRSTGRNLTTRDVSGIHARLDSTVQRVNAKRGLSDHAKRVLIARAYKEARDAITELRDAERARIDGQRATLTRKLFGHEGDADPATAVSRRDALDRAAKLETPEAASSALKRAELSGDAVLAQAIGARAAEMWWGDVLTQYTASRPEAADTVRQIGELPDTSDALWQMQHAMTYSVMQPAELGGMPDYSVDALAAAELDVEAA